MSYCNVHQKKLQSNVSSKILHSCNYKTHSKYTCPFFLLVTKCSETKFSAQSLLIHNHDIDYTQLRLSDTDREFLIKEIKSKFFFEKFIREAPDNLKSIKANVLTANYLNNLYNQYVVRGFGKSDFISTQNWFETQIGSNMIMPYVIKYPGDCIKGLEYPEDGFLACYNFPI